MLEKSKKYIKYLSILAIIVILLGVLGNHYNWSLGTYCALFFWAGMWFNEVV